MVAIWSGASAAIPAVMTTRPPRPEVRRASFSSRILVALTWAFASWEIVSAFMLGVPLIALLGPTQPEQASGGFSGRVQQRDLVAAAHDLRVVGVVAPFEGEHVAR